MRAYIHLPFCLQTCSYCDFCTESGAKQERIENYLDTLISELRSRLENVPTLRSIYIGGGTPSRLNSRQIERLLRELQPWTSELEELTFEIDPGTLSDSKIAILRDYGVDRTSVGIQSFDPELLTELGRFHSPELAIRTIERLHAAGFRIAADLMLGLDARKRRVADDIAQLAQLPIDHCSLYILGLAEGTRLHAQVMDGLIQLPEDSQTATDYQLACQLLNEAGFEQYEISNFARDKAWGLHNLAYWNYESYIGIGASAAGFDGANRYVNTTDIDSYITNWKNGCQIETLDDKTRQQERAMVGLRLRRGINPAQLPLMTTELTAIQTKGHLEEQAGRLRIPQEKLTISNAILEGLF